MPEEKILEGEVVTVRCAHGDMVLYPLAEVEMELDGAKMMVQAAVSDTLPVLVLLGTDVPELGRLLRANPNKGVVLKGAVHQEEIGQSKVD